MAKILLINPTVREEDVPRHVPYGIALLAAIAMEKGHLVQVYDENAWRQGDETTKAVCVADDWDIIGYGGITTTYGSVKRIARIAREYAPQAGQAAAGPALDSATLAAIAGLKARDPAFDPHRFLDGARQAHETIVRGYAEGDREALKPLLTPVVMTSFEAGMADREARGEQERVEFPHVPRADLELATVQGDKAVAKVRFLSELKQTISAGEAEPRVEERRTAELWTFERPLNASDPNWVLARVEPATA